MRARREGKSERKKRGRNVGKKRGRIVSKGIVSEGGVRAGVKIKRVHLGGKGKIEKQREGQ